MILVTGGLDMIGAHTARALVDLGHQLVVTSHRRTGVPSLLARTDTTSLLNALGAARAWGVRTFAVASSLGVYIGRIEIPWHEELALPATELPHPIIAFKKATGRAIALLMSAKTLRGETYNVSSGRPYTNRELVNAAGDRTRPAARAPARKAEWPRPRPVPRYNPTHRRNPLRAGVRRGQCGRRLRCLARRQSPIDRERQKGAIMRDHDVRRVLDGASIAHLATVLPDGSPHATPVYVGTRDDRIHRTR